LLRVREDPTIYLAVLNLFIRDYNALRSEGSVHASFLFKLPTSKDSSRRPSSLPSFAAKLPAKFSVAFSDEMRRNAQATVTDLWYSCGTFTGLQEERPAFGARLVLREELKWKSSPLVG